MPRGSRAGAGGCGRGSPWPCPGGSPWAAARRCAGRTTRTTRFFGRRFPREDRTRTLSVSLHKRDLTLYGFSPQLVVIHERRDSNAQALDSVGSRAELRLVRQF